MGSWHGTCMLSNTAITAGSEVVLDGSGDRYYTTGWHTLPTLEEAQELQEKKQREETEEKQLSLDDLKELQDNIGFELCIAGELYGNYTGICNGYNFRTLILKVKNRNYWSMDNLKLEFFNYRDIPSLVYENLDVDLKKARDCYVKVFEMGTEEQKIEVVETCRDTLNYNYQELLSIYYIIDEQIKKIKQDEYENSLKDIEDIEDTLGVKFTTERTCYDILEVTKKAPEEVIKKSFKDKCLKLHPDINKNVNAVDEFKELYKAYKECIERGKSYV